MNKKSDVVERMAEVPGIDEVTLLGAAESPNAAAALRPMSGLYQRNSPAVLPSPNADEHDLISIIPVPAAEVGMREELRLDVDGSTPQRVASGTIYRALNSQVHWVAKLAPDGPNSWTGTVAYKDGDLGAFPYTNLKILVVRSGSLAPQGARVIFSGGGAPNAERSYAYMSPFFRAVEFEFDHVAGETPILKIDTHAHPNRPANLPSESLTIPKVFQRAGFDVRVSTNTAPLAVTGAGSNNRWSDMEMHDAMRTAWSRFAAKPQWAMWVFYAPLHDEGESLGGIMFDDIGSNHRQGTAIFTRSFIAQAPNNDPKPDAWIRRMQLWCACHEMGHAFNLAHSWQKALGTPWIPLSNEPEARSFMNYPYNVTGGQTAFFANFNYRFSNDELLFMRHAPEKFVQMGNAAWFDHHAFEQANVLPEPTFTLELRSNRPNTRGVTPAPLFQFMEPVVVELKLTNVSGQPQVVPKKLLAHDHNLTVIVKRQGHSAKQVIPYATHCWQPQHVALNPAESIYESLFVSVGKGGWSIAEPGYYTIHVALHRGSEDIVSNPLVIRVAPPQQGTGRTEEYLAQDFFSDDVGRILAFDGSRTLQTGNDAITDVIEQLPEGRAALHCRVAQAAPLTREYKEVTQSGVQVSAAKPEQARDLMADIVEKPEVAAESLGNIDLNYYLSRLSTGLEEAGGTAEARHVLGKLEEGLTERGVKPEVVEQVRAAKSSLGDQREPSEPSEKKRKK